MPALDFTTTEVLNKVLDTTKNALAVSLDTEQSGVIQTVKLSDGTDAALITTGGSQNVLDDNSAAIKTAVELIDDAVYTDGTGTPSKMILIGGTDGTNPQALKVNADGELAVNLETADIQIGAVEIKNGTTDERATVLAASTASAATNTSVVVAIHPSSPLPSGTNGIGKLTANSGVDIGDVDILSIAAGDNNIGNVDVVTLPALVTGSATIGAVTGPTADNVANPTLKLGVLPAVALAAAPTRTEGNVNPLRVTLAGDAVVTLDGEAVVLGAGTAEIGKLAAGVANIGDVDVLTLPALPAGTNNIGDIDVLTVPAPLNVTGTGLEATALRVTIATDSTGVLSIDDNAGSLTVDGTVTANLAAGSNNIGDVDILTIAAGDNNIGNVDIVTLPAAEHTTPTLYAITCTLADTEYSQALPASTRALIFNARNPAHAIRYAFATGKVALPTDPYHTLLAGYVYDKENLKLAATTLYVASSTAGAVAEVEAWS